MPIVSWYGFDGGFQAVAMVASIATVTQKNTRWVIVGTTSFASLGHRVSHTVVKKLVGQNVRHLAAHRLLARVDDYGLVSIVEAVSCASQPRWAHHLQKNIALVKMFTNQICSTSRTPSQVGQCNTTAMLANR